MLAKSGMEKDKKKTSRLAHNYVQNNDYRSNFPDNHDLTGIYCLEISTLHCLSLTKQKKEKKKCKVLVKLPLN